MDDETRRAVDEACLNILGWTELEWVTRELDWEKPYWRGRNGLMWGEAGSPSLDDAFVVPLTKAIRARGWRGLVNWEAGAGNLYCVLLEEADEDHQPTGRTAVGEACSLPLALAMAAAKAVGEEQER